MNYCALRRSRCLLWLSTPISAVVLLFTLGLLSACGGTGSVAVPIAPVPSLTFSIKSAELSWPNVSGATHYEVYETPEVGQSPVLLGTVTLAKFSQPIALYKKINASYSVSACNAAGCSARSANLAVSSNLSELSKAAGHFKASNAEAGDGFAYSFALSADGNTLAVGAYGEDSTASGINGNQTDNSAQDSGAVYVFSRTLNTSTNTSTWAQQAYIKASNAEAGDEFGDTVALSADGNTLAVGAPYEGSASNGINGNEADNTALTSGAVYVFSRTVNSGTNTSTWAQQAYVKSSNAKSGDLFGYAVALSADGNTLAAGAYGEDSATSGINGSQANNGPDGSGAVYVFSRTVNTSTWAQQAFVKASNTEGSDFFGFSVALSGDGNTLAVGALGEDSAATGINGIQTGNTAPQSGAVYVFSRTVNTSNWAQQAYIKASNTESGDRFGNSLAISSNGNTLAVGAYEEDSAATGFNGNQADNSAPLGGAVYVYSRTLNTSNWAHQAYIKASNTQAGDRFGASVALSSDGNTLAAGAYGEDSTASGINGNQADNTAQDSGAVYVFSRTANTSTWAQQAYIKASNTEAGDEFGGAVAISADGNTLAVGAYQEDSASTGINGNQADNSAQDSGAVYLY